MSSAQRIVSSAVNVFGGRNRRWNFGRQKLETKFINVEEVRNNQDELMNRIRRDTHGSGGFISGCICDFGATTEQDY